ncbi:MAG: beta-ketoacyl-[acyl-carrier-protein] synthase family protein [Deltaproteobacteria bacterium]|nr:MAG: beta-ketoacyl-[acyl-carrier-protein] synthase family protein [Deltaproteobacteria bacterium]
MKRVVVTGIGVISPIGMGTEEFWRCCTEGRSGIRPIQSFTVGHLRSKLGGQAKDPDYKKYIKLGNLRRMDRISRMVVASVKLAIEGAGILMHDEDPERVGIMIGTGLGSSKTVDLFFRDLVRDGPHEVAPLLFQTSVPNAICSHASIEFGIKGINSTFSHKETSAESAIVHAFEALRRGKAEVIFAGGADEISEPLYNVYATLGSLSPQRTQYPEGIRPFDRTRNGIVLGEGSGILVMETLEHARRRGASIYAEMVGYGMTAGNYGILSYDRDGHSIAKAIMQAVEDLPQVDYVCAAANSTQVLDRAETIAIREVFGKRAEGISISAIKSMIGEFDASGGIRGCAAVLGIKEGIAPPTINYREPDPECDLDYTVRGARRREIEFALLNGFANGGANISILFKRFS